MKRSVLISALLFAMAGCAHYSLVKPERLAIGDLYTIESRIAWNKATEGHVEVWTVDGPSLEALRFINGLEDGQTLLPVRSDRIKLPRFRGHMTPSEVLEFFVGTLKSFGGGLQTGHLARGVVVSGGVITANINAATVKAANLRPTQFGTLPGFRFDLSFLSREGLERDGMVLGTIHKKRLYLIIYTGAREYYYPKYREEVERLVSSIKIQN